jgi:hypothetical protein
MGYDVTLVESNGRVTAHRPDCPQVQQARAAGDPLMTMYGCQGNMPKELDRHDCLPGVAADAR